MPSRFTFRELYERASDYKSDSPVTRNCLKSIAVSKLDHPPGTLLKTRDNRGHRVLILVGSNQNIVVFDRYPDLKVAIFLYYAPNKVEAKLNPVLRDEDMEYLVDMSYLI